MCLPRGRPGVIFDMTIASDQLRSALADLNGQRRVRLHFENGPSCDIENALLVPAEADNLLKLTDGSREYLVDTGRIAWIEIGEKLAKN